MNLLSNDFPFKTSKKSIDKKGLQLKPIYYSIPLNLLSVDFPFKSKKKTPEKLLCTIEYQQNNSIIEDLGHSWSTPWKKCLSAVLK